MNYKWIGKHFSVFFSLVFSSFSRNNMCKKRWGSKRVLFSKQKASFVSPSKKEKQRKPLINLTFSVFNYAGVCRFQCSLCDRETFCILCFVSGCRIWLWLRVESQERWLYAFTVICHKFINNSIIFFFQGKYTHFHSDS